MKSRATEDTRVSSTALSAEMSCDANRPKPYLSIAELTTVTPWTDQAIRTMIARGVFREGRHFFRVGRRPVFKWEAVVAFIEGRDREPIPLYRGGVLGESQEA
jgi:hypothetical protein